LGARFGPDNPLSGPRLPRTFDEETGDPANGGCFGCGDKTTRLMDFGLVYRGKAAGHWRLCETCYEWGNTRDPRDTDPRQAA